MAHHHHHHHAEGRLEGRMIFSVILNLFITIVQIIGGLIAGSLALISDALHNLTDTFSLVISFFAVLLAKREKTEARTFGYERAEILAALFNAVLLIVVSVFLLKEAVLRLMTPSAVNGWLMIIVAGIGFAANLLSAVLLKEDSHDNMNVRAAYLHLFMDAMTSLAVIGGGVGVLLLKWTWIDPALSILLVIYIVREAWQIVLDAVGILMHKTPHGINIRSIQKAIQKLPGVKNIHHVHIWQLTERDMHFEAHIDLSRDMKVSESCVLKARIEELLHDTYGIEHCTLQLEYGTCAVTPLIKP